jgi:cellulose synthase operon protein C
MIIRFPDLKTLQLALTSGAVPVDIAQKPAVAGFGEEEQLWVETPAKLSAAAQRELKRLSALVCKSSGAALSTEVSCWLELLPLAAEDAPLDVLEQTPVLFDVPSGEELARLVLEMLRLGNDRQSYRWLEQTNNGDNGRALLRVVGPPYYSLLRALDQMGGPSVAPHAFVERAPGVWVEVGHRHPLAAKIKPPKGRALLLRPPRQWLMLPDASFHDIYDIVEFQLPDGPARWQESSLPQRLKVAPRLRQSGPAEGAELWVLRGDAIDELNRFVQTAEDVLLSRLAFAVADKDGQTLVVLRVRQSKLPPPILVLPAEAYKSHLKLPNLFLPAGYSLHPPLRRDVVRKLLAEDVSQITWLLLGENGQFTPESIADDVFRPLTDWVDYVLDRDRQQLHAWVQAMQFDFEPFICDEEQSRKPKKPPDSEKSRAPKAGPKRAETEGNPSEKSALQSPSETSTSDTEDVGLDAFTSANRAEPSALEKELHAVEEEFLALPGGLEEPARQAMWPRMAHLNAQLRKTEDASLCWLNAMWDAGENAGNWATAWFRTEARGAMHRHADSPRSGKPWVAAAASEDVRREVSADELDCLLALAEPTTSDLRAFAAYLAWSAHRDPRPTALGSRLPAMQRLLEKHENLLPVRACWLAWYHLVQLTDGDVLALARARDRLLERLFHNGLRPEQDLPSFLCFAGQSSDKRGRALGQWLLKMNELARGWVDRQRRQDALEPKGAKTKEYLDLLFAFGLARLGEHDAGRQLVNKAKKKLANEDEAHAILYLLFDYRIRQAMEGQSTNTPLEEEALDRLNALRQKEQERRSQTSGRSGGTSISPFCYIIDKMRGTSRILEPLQKILEYRYIAAPSNDEEEQTLAKLPDIKERSELAERIHWLIKRGRTRLALFVRILKAALEQSPRVGEEIAQHLLEQALRAYDQSVQLPAGAEARPSLELLMDLLERGLFVAAHFGRLDAVQALMVRFRQLLRDEHGSSSITGFDRVVEQGLRGLRKLGLREEIQELLTLMADAILKGRSPMMLLAQKDTGSLWRVMLPIAAAWYDSGRDSLAEPIYQAARTVLFRNELLPTEHLALACAYAKALGAAPIPILQERIEELFERLEGIPNTSSYGNYYSPSQVKLVESVVLAVVNDDFTQGAQARRWLDEDEYLVRQRIHGDVRNLLAQV